MEAFNVFAVFTLQDMMSGPLSRINAAMHGVKDSAETLSARFGRLTMSMAPVAVAAGVLLGAFGAATAKAIAFESAMADVAKVVNFENAAEIRAFGNEIRDMAGRIPMAAEGIAAIVAAAGQSGVAKEQLTDFAEQAAKMGVAFDLTGDQAGKMMADWRAGMNLALPEVYALADAVNHLSNNMNATAPALGEVIQRVGAAAMSCGLAEQQVAALGAAFLSAGASPEIAATALKKFTTTLVKGAAMSETQAAAFRELGFSATEMAKTMQTDAQGTIFKVLQALADKPKELQMSLLTQMFGEEAIGAIAPLLQNMGNLSQAFELVGDSANYAGSMQKEFEARSATTANALQLLRNKAVNLGISVGNAFLPAVGWAAEKLGVLVDALRAVADTEMGQWLLRVAGALATALVALTALSASMWAFSSLGSILVKALLPLKMALLGLGAPILAVIAAVGALYVAYKTNFGGIADTLNRWWKNITLVVRGVLALFKSLTDGSGEIRGELATEIKAAGLVGLVTTVARAVYRIKEFFTGLWDALDFSPLTDAFAPVGRALSSILETLGNLFARVFGGEVSSAADSARSLGDVVGGALSAGMRVLAGIVEFIAFGVEHMANVFGLLVSLFTGDFAAAGDYLKAIFEGLGRVFAKFGELVGSIFGGLGDIVQAAWDAVIGVLTGAWDTVIGGLTGFGASLLAGIQEAWDRVLSFFDGINLFESGEKLLSTFVDGIKSMAMAPIEAVSGILSTIRDYLPFSDAKTGPLSTLTLSGQRMMTTLADGVLGGAASLLSTVTGALSGVGEKIGGWWDSLWGEASTPDVPTLPEMPGMPPMEISMGPLPDMPQPAVPRMPPLELQTGALPDISGPHPEPPVVPDVPEVTLPADRKEDKRAEYESDQGGRTFYITISNLSLPNVTNAPSFMDELSAAMASLEGA